MLLFNKFTETIFYKNNSELENQISALKKVIEKYPNNQRLKKQLTLCELGLRGEHEIEFELKNANLGMYVLHDVNLEFEDLKAQIDYVVITSAKVYFIECKNLTGNITVNNNGEFSREWNFNGHKIKEGIYSPLRQAERHIEVYEKIWSSRNKGLLNKIRYNNMDNWYVPLVVMANSKNILNIKYAPKELKNKIIRSDNLIKYLQSDIARTNKDYLWSKKDMEEYANTLMNNYNKIIDKNYEEQYLKYAEEYLYFNNKNESNEIDLKNKLIEFRKNRSSEMKIPAYYVFTNEELERLITLKPSTLDELKNSKILSPIKIKTHGDEIIKLLNYSTK